MNPELAEKNITITYEDVILSRCYARHKIYDRDHLINDNFPFSPKKYSKFKFGDKTAAREFGYALAKGFINSFMEKVFESDNLWSAKQIVVVSSPYCFIPTATFAMKDYFIQCLNDWLVKHDYPVVQEAKIYRTITYTEDYGGLSSEEREKLIGKDGFYIDREFVKNKFVLYLDDIKITGSHEKVIRKMISDCNLEHEYLFLYYAQLANIEVHPKIENDLNYAFVKSLLDLDKIIKNDHFLLNTRVVKYILNSPFEEFKNFINYQSKKFVNTVYHSAMGNSYHLIDNYKTNFTYLKTMI